MPSKIVSFLKASSNARVIKGDTELYIAFKGNLYLGNKRIIFARTPQSGLK